MNYRADRFTVVLDTNVLVGALIRNMILSLAEAGIFRPRWSTATINDEFARVFERLYPNQAGIALKQRDAILTAFPEGIAEVEECIVKGLSLPDPDDRHVLAAAIKTKASLIVTSNLKDFPLECLAQHEVEAISADDFIADCIDLAGPEAVAALRTMRERLKKPEIDAEGLLTRIEQVGLTQTAILLARFKALL